MNKNLVEKIRKVRAEKKLDAVIVTDIYEILNLLDINASFNIIEIGFYLLITEKELFLIGDPFSFSFLKIPEEVKVRKADISSIKKEGFSPVGELKKLLEELNVKKIGSFGEINLINFKTVKIPDPFATVFLKPDKKRLYILKENASICEKVLKKALKELRNNVGEISIRNIIDEEIYKLGGERRAFPTKVIFGKSTSNPFALSNNSKLKDGDAIVFNFGIIRAGVGIEVARTFIWGKFDKSLGKTYNEITEIYEKFLSFISYGKIAKEIYKYVFELIKEKGYDRNFIPPINAPLTLSGKSINISKNSNFILKEGTLLFPQLNFYFPGKFGIKFQDIFFLGGKNYNLTDFLTKGEVSVLLVPDKV
jgi:Xaa-Pro aminopeptidase